MWREFGFSSTDGDLTSVYPGDPVDTRPELEASALNPGVDVARFSVARLITVV